MLKGGINVKVVSEGLGHSGVALKLNVCSHVLPNMQEEAARRIDGLLPPSPGANVGASSWLTLMFRVCRGSLVPEVGLEPTRCSRTTGF
jgi:hypothetical protein